MRVWEVTGRMPDELDEPAIPHGTEALAGVFMDLHARRHGNGFGPLPITDGDLRNWQYNHRTRLSPWEVDTLYLMDKAALAVLAESKT